MIFLFLQIFIVFSDNAILEVAKEDNESDGDLILKDIGTGIPIRPGVIDGAIR